MESLFIKFLYSDKATKFDEISSSKKSGGFRQTFCCLLRKFQLYLVYVDGYQEAKYGLIYNSPWIIKLKKIMIHFQIRHQDQLY